MTPTITRLLAALTIAALSGCEVDMTDRIDPPLTAEQARARVITAGREIAGALALPVREAWFWRGSCRDNGGPPYRGQMRIAYDKAANSALSDAQIAATIARLRASGWTEATAFHTRSAALRKDGIHAVFRPQNASTATRGVEVLGDCRDITGDPSDHRRPERVDLTPPDR